MEITLKEKMLLEIGIVPKGLKNDTAGRDDGDRAKNGTAITGAPSVGLRTTGHLANVKAVPSGDARSAGRLWQWSLPQRRRLDKNTNTQQNPP